MFELDEEKGIGIEPRAHYRQMKERCMREKLNSR